MNNPVNNQQPKKKYEKSPDEVGCAWIKNGNAGQYLSLSLDITPDMVGTRVPLVAFLKKVKTSDNQPDYTVLKSKKLNVASVTPPPKAEKAASSAAKTQRAAAPVAAEQTDLDF